MIDMVINGAFLWVRDVIGSVVIYGGGAGVVGDDCWKTSTYLLRTFFFDA